VGVVTCREVLEYYETLVSTILFLFEYICCDE